MLQEIRTLIGHSIPDRVQELIGRHFTWLTATLLGFSLAGNLIIILLYVPVATANTVVNATLTAGAAVVTVVSFIGGVLTIHDYLNKRLPDRTNPGTEEPTQGGLSSPTEGFVRTDEELMEEARKELEGWFIVYENGEIELRPEPDQFVHDRKAMLYVFAAYVASDARVRDNPSVSKEEIMDEIGFSTNAANVFINKMGDFIHRNFDPTATQVLHEMDNDQIMFTLNVREVPEAVKYIKDERGAPN